MQIVPVQPTQATAIVSSSTTQDRHDWLDHFDPVAAVRSVAAHVAALPSTRKTPEKHTSRTYEAGLSYFLAYLSGHLDDTKQPIAYYATQPMPLPTEALMVDYIAHLSLRGLAASTIGSRYLAPARHWLRALIKQRPQVIGEERNRVEDYRAAIEDACNVSPPKPETSSTRSALYRHGNRLTTTQINDLFAIIAHEPQELTRKRDLALLYVGLTSALRVAELGRITLASITPADNCYEITVRGKRNQIDPVAVDSLAVDLIHDWVDAWNDAVGEGDLRRIGPHTPIWQHIRVNGEPANEDQLAWKKAWDYTADPNSTPVRTVPTHEIERNLKPKPKGGVCYVSIGIARQNIARIIRLRAKQALGIVVSPHDLRRSYAARAKEAGLDLTAISRQLRHQSIATTQRYIGDPPNPAAGLLTNVVPIVIPRSA